MLPLVALTGIACLVAKFDFPQSQHWKLFIQFHVLPCEIERNPIPMFVGVDSNLDDLDDLENHDDYCDRVHENENNNEDDVQQIILWPDIEARRSRGAVLRLI